MSKLIPKMKYAFFGMSLEKGSKTVAYLNIFTYTIMATIFIINAWHPNLTTGGEAYALGKNIKATFFLESTTILQLVFSGFLLYGATVRDGKLLIAWILQQSGLVFHSQLIIVINFIMLFDGGKDHRFGIISFLFEEVAIIGFQFYCMLVVYHYQQQIESAEDEQENTD